MRAFTDPQRGRLAAAPSPSPLRAPPPLVAAAPAAADSLDAANNGVLGETVAINTHGYPEQFIPDVAMPVIMPNGKTIVVGGAGAPLPSAEALAEPRRAELSSAAFGPGDERRRRGRGWPLRAARGRRGATSGSRRRRS
jgi:hypothetical protein